LHSDGNPNAIIELNFCIFDSASLPIGTNSMVLVPEERKKYIWRKAAECAEISYATPTG
jgi:hypothetical protein